MNPTKQAYEAAAKLQSPEMKPFLDWLMEERARDLEFLSVAKPEITQVLQGRTQAFGQIIGIIQESRDILEKRK